MSSAPKTVVRGSRAVQLDASVVTAGTFDGVHLGHLALASRAVERAKALNVTSVAYTFDPHPAKVLAPSKAPALLISIEDRVRLLAVAGIDVIVVEPFDHTFAEIDADVWVEKYLVKPLQPKVVIVGFNFSYGRGRAGDPEHLRRAGEHYGFDVEIVGAIEAAGGVVSSSRIRKLLESGDVAAANVLLGRSFTVSGTVVEGDRRGRTIGVPTANLSSDAEMVPKNGVYASRVELPDGRRFGSVTNIGTRPTFDGEGKRLEAHLFDFDEDLYGKQIRVELVARLRDEQKFASLDALIAQIKDDMIAARKIVP